MRRGAVLLLAPLLLGQAYPPGNDEARGTGGTAFCPVGAVTVGDTVPSGSGALPGGSITLQAKATADQGVVQVCFYYQYCPTGCDGVWSPGSVTLIGCDATPDGSDWYDTLWVFPDCDASPQDNHSVWFQAIDICGTTDEKEVDDVLLSGRGC